MKKIGIGLYILYSGFCLQAQVMSLDSILHIIAQKHPEIRMYEAQKQAFTAYAQGAKAWEAPQLSAGFFMTPYKPSLWQSKPDGAMAGANQGMGSFMLQGQQMITHPAKLKANERYMNSMAAVEDHKKDEKTNELRYMAKMAYYEWAILLKKLEVLVLQERQSNYLLQITERRYPYGQEKLSVLYNIKASQGELQNMQSMLQSEIHWKRAILNQYMNRAPAIEFEIDTHVVHKSWAPNVLDSTWAAQKSKVAVIDKNIQVAQYKQSYALSQRKPDFGIQYAHMFAFGNNPNLFSIMGMLSIPMAPWSSKMYKSSAQGLKAEIQAYQSLREGLISEAVAEAHTLQRRIHSQQQQLSVYEKTILPALNKHYASSLLAYEQNTEDLNTVLEAIEALQMSKMELLTKKGELLYLQAAYEKTIEHP